jgi:gliding motility-associated-like protein
MIVEKCKMPLSFKVNQTLLYCLLFLCNLLFSFLLKAEESNLNSKETALAKAKDWISTSSEKGFIENKGQMSDNDGKPVPFVLFKTEAPNVNIWITESGMTIQTLVVRKEEIAESQMNEIEKQESKQNHKPKKRKFIDWERIDLEFKGANIRKENVIKENPDGTNFNFFYGHCQSGIYGVKEYQKITFKNIYPNIDWVIYRKKEGEVKYDFVVHAGADYKQIELIYKSKSQINLNQEGQLEFSTQYGDIIEKKPVSFCQNNTVNTKFKLNYQKQHIINGDNGFESSYSFNFENFNTSNTEDLIIDPDLVWSTFYGGNYLDGPTSIDTDQDGNIFVTGYVASSNFPTLNALGGSYFQGTFGLGSDVMLLKFNNAGLRLWATYYGGSGGDRGWFVTTDVNGNVYVTGDTEGPDFPVLDAGGGAYFQNTVQGQLDLFVLKFNNSGVLQFGTCFGGNDLDFGFSISIDNNGNFYVTGQTNSMDLPTLDAGAGSYYQANNGGANVFNSFLIKFNSACVLQWSTYYGGDSYETGYGVTNDAFGNVFMVGKSESSDFPLLNAGGSSYFQANGGIGNSNAYVVKFSNSGVRLWATSIGGSLIDEALSVIADDNGDIIITGKTFSNNFPLMNPGGGAYFQGTFGGVIDIFMARFTNNGTQLWTTYFGGTSGENQSWYDNLAIDSCRNIYMTLSSAINDIPLLAQCEGGFIDSLFNGSDVILVKFSTTNEILWSTFIGGNGLDFQGALAVDNNKNVFLSGEWCGTSVNNASYPLVNAGGGTYFDGTFNGGGDDGFVLKFAPTIPIINTNILQPSCANLCAGEAAVSITGSCNYSYLWNNGQTTQTAIGLCPGNYTVQITNPICGGLDTLIQVTIVAPPSSITPSFAAFGNFCAGDTIQTLPTTSINNVTGIWSPALNNSVTTTYTFTPNAGQCALDTQLTIQINPLPVVNAFSNNVFCENQALQLSVNTTVGASYSWQGPNAFTSIQQNNSIPNLTSANSGSYIVNVNLNSCISSDTIDINIIAPTFFNQSIQLCNGQSYQLPDGSFTDSAGVFNHLFLGVNGCDSIINTTVILVNAVQSNISAQICNGQSYLLPDSNVVFNTGLYEVTIPSIAGCDSIIQINLIAANTSVDSLSIQLCQGQNYTLPDGNIANTNGVFPVVLQNQFGCDSIIVTSINVLQNIIPSLQINAIPNNIICAGSPVLFTSTISNIGVNPIYQWYINGIALLGAVNDSLTISSLQNSDTISLTIISSLNCNDSNIVYSNNIVISVISAPNYLLHISCSDSILCALQKTTFTASVSSVSSNFIYQWYINNILLQESNDSTFIYSNFNDGDSIICSIVTPIVCNGMSQIYSNAIVIKVNPNPTIDLVIYEYWQNYGDTLQLIGNTNVSNAVYYWSANANLSCNNCSTPYIIALDTMQYMLTVTDASTGCFTIDSLVVYVIEDFDIFLPNGFSPNGDNVNDIFLLRGRGIKDFILNVYDRWGELIFTSNNLNYGWDGTFNSKPLMSGTYVYTLSYTNFKNVNKFTKGNLTLIR